MNDGQWLTVQDAAEKLKVHPSWIRYLCRIGRVHGAQRLGNVWMVPDPPVILGKLIEEGLVTAADAARVLGLSRQRVVLLCRQGHIEGARKQGRHWAIPLPVKRLPRAQAA